MAASNDDLSDWLKKELGPAGYRKVKDLQKDGMTIEQALELYQEIERTKGNRP